MRKHNVVACDKCGKRMQASSYDNHVRSLACRNGNAPLWWRKLHEPSSLANPPGASSVRSADDSSEFSIAEFSSFNQVDGTTARAAAGAATAATTHSVDDAHGDDASRMRHDIRKLQRAVELTNRLLGDLQASFNGLVAQLQQQRQAPPETEQTQVTVVAASAVQVVPKIEPVDNADDVSASASAVENDLDQRFSDENVQWITMAILRKVSQLV